MTVTFKVYASVIGEVALEYMSLDYFRGNKFLLGFSVARSESVECSYEPEVRPVGEKVL